MTDSGTHSGEFLAFGDALGMVVENVPVLPAEEVDVGECAGYVAAQEVTARVDSPFVDVSLMDGFAVAATGTAQASQENPVRLRVAGSVAAGNADGGSIGAGEATRIFTGAVIPNGTDAVIRCEDCEETDGEVTVKALVEPGENVQPRGEDIRRGEVVLREGALISPGMAGMLAAAGVDSVRVVRRPRVAILATGDELVAPGKELAPGRTYASNSVNVCAWLERFGVESSAAVVRDSMDEISAALRKVSQTADAIVTIGGAWGSERDLVPGALDEFGWTRKFHRVRMKPGKGAAFGLRDGQPVFCLPGGPAACEIAFLQLALPGILHTAGVTTSPFPVVEAELTEEIRPRLTGWRRFVYGTHQQDAKGGYSVKPLLGGSRLKSMAQATCIIILPESRPGAAAGENVTIQILK